MRRDGVRLDLCDVARNLVVAVIVGLVGSLRVTVPFTRKDTAASQLFKSAPQSAYAGEQVNETECLVGRCRRMTGADQFLQNVKRRLARLALPPLPAIQGADRKSDLRRKVLDGDTGLLAQA